MLVSMPCPLESARTTRPFARLEGHPPASMPRPAAEPSPPVRVRPSVPPNEIKQARQTYRNTGRGWMS
eukprot:3554538-Pyramimonas_sp.AAC.1